jgi:hypothetical protein
MPNLKSTDIEFPLISFQATELSSQDDVLKMSQDINSNADSQFKISDNVLNTAFEQNWENFKLGIDNIKTGEPKQKNKRSERDMLEEILQLVRRDNHDMFFEKRRRMYGMYEMEVVHLILEMQHMIHRVTRIFKELHEIDEFRKNPKIQILMDEMQHFEHKARKLRHLY